MEALEVNMYVRTKCGIEQIYRIDNNKTKWKYVYKLKEQDGDGCINIGILSSEDILKASHNIIKILEEDDIVNGEIVTKVKEDDEGIYLVTIFNNVIREKNIKSIVTKEQFEAIQYKVV